MSIDMNKIYAAAQSNNLADNRIFAAIKARIESAVFQKKVEDALIKEIQQGKTSSILTVRFFMDLDQRIELDKGNLIIYGPDEKELLNIPMTSKQLFNGCNGNFIKYAELIGQIVLTTPEGPIPYKLDEVKKLSKNDILPSPEVKITILLIPPNTKDKGEKK